MPSVRLSPVERVLHRARSYVGQREKPLGSNTGGFVRRCQRSTFLPGTGWPWCGAFLDLVFTEERMPFPSSAPTASAFGMLNWARLAKWDIGAPRPGALGVVNAGAGHICLVESYDKRTGMVASVDGNVAHSVAKRHRHVSEFRGFIWHPKLSSKPATVPKKIRNPWWEIATSERGHKKVLFRGPAAKALERLPGLLKKTANGVTVKRGKPKP